MENTTTLENSSEVKKKKVYCSFGHTHESNWIQPLGFELTNNIDDADLILFGGGKDVDPGFYGEKKGNRTCSPSNRDKEEKKDFQYIQDLRKSGKKVKTIGICRGAQLACALSGGKLIQDVSNHSGRHTMSTFDRQTITINSIHHQMMFPYGMPREDYKILGWSTENLSSRYLNGFDKGIWLPNGFKELEVVLFKNTDSLAIQCHPEMMYGSKVNDVAMNWMENIFNKFYNDEL